MQPEPVIRVHLVRHGETNENRTGIIQGQMDTKLNADGSQQARLCAEALKDIRFAAAFSSDLQRTMKTTEIILMHHPSVEVIKDEQLRERDMGELQGIRFDQYDRSKLPKSVEGGEAFTKRTLRWWEETIGKRLPSVPLDVEMLHVLVVSHGAFIATLCRALVAQKIIDFDMETRFGTCFNTSVTTIDMCRDKRGRLVKYSDISHLARPAVAINADEQPQA